ncbi:hypothetical protein J6590_060971 [Homalodisca vitripennis]|nr:hypothetical protein J6590_060971 [Homalodisca vitripennis]
MSFCQINYFQILICEENSESSDDLEKLQVKISALENDEKLDLETSLTIAGEVGNALLKENEEKKKELHDLKMLINNLHTECEDKIKKIEEMNKLILEDKDSELREKILEIKFKDNKLKKEVEIRNNLCLEYEESNRNTVNKMLKLEAALKLEKSLHAKQISTNKCLLKDLKTKDITLEKLKMESNNLTVTESSQSTDSKLCCHRSNQSEMKQAIEIMEQINQDLEDKIKNEKGKNEVLLGKIILLEKQLSEKSAEVLHLQSTIAKFSLPKNNTFPKVLVNNSSQTNQEKKEKKITKINLDMYDRIKCLQDALLEKNQLISNIENSKNSINESESNINSVIGKNIQAGEFATLTILSDSHGRHLDYHLKKINSTVSVKSCVIPGANLDRVMSGASDLVKNRNNFVTLIAGANDIYNGQINTFLKNLRPAVMALKPCKILIGTIPFRRDLALQHQINEDIMRANLYIHELSHSIPGVYFLDLTGLSNCGYDASGIHLSYLGKKFLSYKINKLISRTNTSSTAINSTAIYSIPETKHITILDKNMEDEIKQFGKCKTTAFSHCISADVSNSRNMTAGVAVIFKRHFGRPSHSDFVNSHLTCQVPDGSATVYGLVTKPKYDTKPTSYDYAQAFAQLQEDLKKRNLKELICSPMGCVRDKISVEDFAAKIVNFQLNTGANVKIVTFEQPTAKRILFNGYSHSEFIKSLQHFISMQYQNRAATYTTPAELSSETGNTTIECKQAPTCAVLESVSAWKDPVTLVTRASHEYN